MMTMLDNDDDGDDDDVGWCRWMTGRLQTIHQQLLRFMASLLLKGLVYGKRQKKWNFQNSGKELGQGGNWNFMPKGNRGLCFILPFCYFFILCSDHFCFFNCIQICAWSHVPGQLLGYTGQRVVPKGNRGFEGRSMEIGIH